MKIERKIDVSKMQVDVASQLLQKFGLRPSQPKMKSIFGQAITEDPVAKAGMLPGMN